MFALPDLFVDPAKEAGIEVPENLDFYDPEKYPYWHVLLNSCLGMGMPQSDCQWHNAKIIADIPRDQLKSVTLADLIHKGLSIST